MPRTQITLTVCFSWLLVGAAALAQAQRGPAPSQSWPPAGNAAGYATPGQGVQQAGYTTPLPGPPAGPAALPATQTNATATMPLSPPQRKTGEPLPLARRGKTSSDDSATGPGGALLTTMGSLAVVLCLFFAVAWVLRRGTPHSLAALPSDVVEILGRAPLPGRHQMHLVRCGHKLLLVAVSTAGADTLTEITDPLEVDRLCGLCRQSHPQSATASFRNILNQFGVESAPAAKTRFARAIEDEDA